MKPFLLEYVPHQFRRGFAVCADQPDRPPDAAGVLLAVNPHRDEMWIWIADTRQAEEHLASFLSSFGGSAEITNNEVDVELCGPNAELLKVLFEKYFAGISCKIADSADQGLPIAIVRYNAGSINSRKAMITPHIPRVIT